jgi:aminopeptidase N
MLRWEVGDELFFKIKREYFERFKYKSASIEDFKAICEELSGKNLTQFFDQWIYEGNDQIKLNVVWSIESRTSRGNTIKIDVNQYQDRYKVFFFPIEFHIIDENGRYETVKFWINQRNKTMLHETKLDPVSLAADPNNWLLANINVVHK